MVIGPKLEQERLNKMSLLSLEDFVNWGYSFLRSSAQFPAVKVSDNEVSAADYRVAS